MQDLQLFCGPPEEANNGSEVLKIEGNRSYLKTEEQELVQGGT